MSACAARAPGKAPDDILGRARISFETSAPCVLVWRPPGNATDEAPS
jgi:hypothetical protein